MAIANTSLLLKKSGISGNTPTSLANGELAINFSDGKLFYKNALGNISYFYGANNGPSFSTTNANNSLITASTPNDILGFNSANGISITACTSSKTITIDGSLIYNLANSANSYANTAYNTAITSGFYANLAYNTANVAGVYANLSYNTANVAGVYANLAYNTANAANVYANTAYNAANIASVYANIAFAAANAAAAAVTAYVGDNPPVFPTANSLWWKSDEGTLKIYYTDPNGAQWVDAVSTTIGPQGPTGPPATIGYVYDLDDISYKSDGFTNTFPLTYNYANTNIGSPFLITVSVNGAIQPAFEYKYDTVWLSKILGASKGYTIDNVGNPKSNGYIKFAQCPPRGAQIVVRTVVGNAPTTSKLYPFKPLDVFMGY